MNGVYVNEDPGVKCENIWQRRCWQKSLGRRRHQWFGTSLKRDQRNPKEVQWYICLHVKILFAHVATHLFLSQKKLPPKFETYDNWNSWPIWSITKKTTNTDVQMCNILCTKQSIWHLFLPRYFVTKYSNIFKNVNITHYLFCNSITLFKHNQDNKGKLHHCWRIQAAHKLERRLN